jgi:hypothetical protein
MGKENEKMDLMELLTMKVRQSFKRYLPGRTPKKKRESRDFAQLVYVGGTFRYPNGRTRTAKFFRKASNRRKELAYWERRHEMGLGTPVKAALKGGA